MKKIKILTSVVFVFFVVVSASAHVKTPKEPHTHLHAANTKTVTEYIHYEPSTDLTPKYNEEHKQLKTVVTWDTGSNLDEYFLPGPYSVDDQHSYRAVICSNVVDGDKPREREPESARISLHSLSIQGRDHDVQLLSGRENDAFELYKANGDRWDDNEGIIERTKWVWYKRGLPAKPKGEIFIRIKKTHTCDHFGEEEHFSAILCLKSFRDVHGNPLDFSKKTSKTHDTLPPPLNGVSGGDNN